MRGNHSNSESELKRLDDSALVRLCQQGRHQAFDELLSRHRPRFLNVAAGILRNRDDAEDEVQNAFWNACRHIGDFQQNAQFSSWMTRIVVNQCLMRLRGERRRREVPMEYAPPGEEAEVIDLPDTRRSPEEELAGSQLREVVGREIRRIPPLLRQVVQLTHVDELPIPQAADRLGISVPALKSRLLRARRELRTRLERHVDSRGPASLLAAS